MIDRSLNILKMIEVEGHKVDLILHNIEKNILAIEIRTDIIIIKNITGRDQNLDLNKTVIDINIQKNTLKAEVDQRIIIIMIIKINIKIKWNNHNTSKVIIVIDLIIKDNISNILNLMQSHIKEDINKVWI